MHFGFASATRMVFGKGAFASLPELARESALARWILPVIRS